MKVLVLLAVVFLSACISPMQAQIQEVSFKTEDGFTIYGTLYKGSSTGLILLHMLNNDRNSWKPLAEKLAENYTVLAIDMRGHGQSTFVDSEKRTWQSFSVEDFSRMTLDVKAAKEFLLTQNVKDTTIIGASIGANVALKYADQDKEIKSVVLLSPGFDYRGVNITETIKSYERPILLAASEEDSYSADTVKYLYFFASGKKLLALNRDARHGTNMLDKGNLTELVLQFLGSV